MAAGFTEETAADAVIESLRTGERQEFILLWDVPGPYRRRRQRRVLVPEDFEEITDPEAAAKWGVPVPFRHADFDIVMQPGASIHNQDPAGVR